MINNENRKYVIPLTSAKEKHKGWADVSANCYRIYEIIDITKTPTKSGDILVDIKNQDILNKIGEKDRINYKQRILSVLDMRKMFPVKDGLYKEIKFEISNSQSKRENQKMALLMKEYSFLMYITDKIEEKATKIYNKQIGEGKVLKYHCDFKKLEIFCDQYKIK